MTKLNTALYSPQDGTNRSGGEELIETWQKDAESWLWIDIESEPTDEIRQLLRTQFNIDDLAISDAFRVRHPPKIENFEDNIFLLARGLDAQTTDIDYKTIQIALFIGGNFLITFRLKESLSIDKIWRAAESGELKLTTGPVFIACKILRAVVDRYTPILLALEKRLEEMEEELFLVRDDNLLEELVAYNANLKKMRRTLTYHSGVFSEFEKLKQVTANKRNRHLAHDVFEHFDRLRTLSDLYQELVVDLINSYLSLSTHRLNQIMKILTIFTVIFLPLTLLVGIYGMNFEYMPELGWRYGYFFLLGFMASILVIAFGIFRWNKWL